MSLNTYPNNPFPPSTEQTHRGDNEELQAQIDAIKDSATIDSFGDVETALATKTDNDVIAPEFDAEAGVYSVGDLVMHEGKLYEFTTAHETAGVWNPEEVTEKTVADEVDTLKSGLTNVANQIVGIKAGYLSSSSGDTVYIPAKVYPRVLIVLNNQGSDGTNGRPTIVGVLSMGQSGAYKFEQITNITDYALSFTYDNVTDPNNPRYAVQYINVSDSTPQTYLRGFYITADLRWGS